MRLLCLSIAISLMFVSVAHAQDDKRPIGHVAFDLRGFYSGLGQDPITATNLDVDAATLPTRALGGIAGIHVYVIRRSSFALGLGAEGVLARGRRQEKDAETGAPVGLPITQRFRSLAPQISLNFGHRQGWSYLSAGMGPLAFSTYLGPNAPGDPPPVKSTINMGAGARWFSTQHVAFAFDLRFYLTRPIEETVLYPGRQRARIMVLSAGIAIK
ncbi:MAG: hypothetical protein ABI634_14945 [Acidobacteriota bacterium]